MSDETKKTDADREKKEHPHLFDHSRFIIREWGQAAAVECMPGVPVSKTLADKLAR